MSDRILVTGATGLQGGAVAGHLLKLGKPEVMRCPEQKARKSQIGSLHSQIRAAVWKTSDAT